MNMKCQSLFSLIKNIEECLCDWGFKGQETNTFVPLVLLSDLLGYLYFFFEFHILCT